MPLNIFPYTVLPRSDKDLKTHLNHNPWLKRYTKKQNFKSRNPEETDRGGWRGYDRVYSHYISHLREQPITMMEVGVHSGYGLIAWARYFANATIHGMEKSNAFDKLINEHKTKYGCFSRVTIHKCSSTEKESWDKFDQTFDIIIDDGSHKPLDQLDTMKYALPLVKPGGFYFIEDMSCRYTNPTVDVVFDAIEQLGDGYESCVYYHENAGWREALDNKDLWPRYGITEETPYKYVDYIAVIKKNA